MLTSGDPHDARCNVMSGETQCWGVLRGQARTVEVAPCAPIVQRYTMIECKALVVVETDTHNTI